jgi:hypothetical protein
MYNLQKRYQEDSSKESDEESSEEISDVTDGGQLKGIR